jgi:hypothetical protein
MDAAITKRSATSFTIEVDIPYEYSSMLHAEEVIQAQINKVGSLATGEALKQFDTDGAPVFVAGQKLTSKGQIQKTYQTPYGDVTIDRHVYQGSHGGRGYCPLEYHARIITTATPKYAKMVTSKYADGSGLRVQHDLQENHGRAISKSHIQQICEVVGSIASVKEASWNYSLPSFDRAVTTVTIGVDGTGMLMCDDGARQAMVGTLGFYTAEGTRLHTIYVAACPEYGKETFFRRMDQEIGRVKQRYPTACYVGLADGAKDNWTFLEQHTESQIIDFYHACKYIGDVGQAVISKKRREKWIEETCHTLKHTDGAAQTICEELRGYLTRQLSPANRQAVASAVTYFENHGHQMAYAQAVAQPIPIGSGVTEAACKVIVKQRLCGSGMQWKAEGAAVVLTLRCLNYSEGRWEQFWQKIDRYGFSLASYS